MPPYPYTIKVAGLSALLVNAVQKELTKHLAAATSACEPDDMPPVVACVLRDRVRDAYNHKDETCLYIFAYTDGKEKSLPADWHISCTDEKSIRQGCVEVCHMQMDWIVTAIQKNKAAREAAVAAAAVKPIVIPDEVAVIEPAAKRRRIAALVKELAELTKTDA